MTSNAVIVWFALAAVAVGAEFDTEKTAGAPMAAEKAAASIALPAGFHATLFAGEPDIRQPIAMATDARGRLWVAENYTYSERAVSWHAVFRDRILVFEDTDHDGRFDQRTVFCENLERLTSIEVGLGGVWALCLPNLVFIPDPNGDDLPDGPPQMMLDGFEYLKSRHNVANGLRWGPDGWLYGRQGILGASRIGAPGTPEAQRTPVNVGIWRFHPERRAFEVVVAGTTNPWGMDWNAHGEGFFINTVIGHLWQVIPGAHYRRMFGPDPNPHTYELIDQHADHVHWATGEVWTDVRKGVTSATSATGGGHAHTGLLIYQGGQWPAEWEGRLLTINFHGRRLNVERLERKGSAIIGRREPDAFQFADTWFRGIDLLAAPDGGVFVSDWSDAGECHDNDGIQRSSGRIFKLTFGETAERRAYDLSRMDAAALVDSQRSRNDWIARQGRRVLAERAAAGANLASEHAALHLLLRSAENPIHRLRALWSLHVSTGLAREQLAALLSDRDEYIRTWSIRLLTDDRSAPNPEGVIAKLSTMAERDASASVRLALAAALQRLPAAAAARIARPLLMREDDAADHNLPLMLWYGIEPLATAPEVDFVQLAGGVRLPQIAKFAARRVAEDLDSSPARLDTLLTSFAAAAPGMRLPLLDGVAEGLAGRRKAPKPTAWDTLRARFAGGADEALARRIRDLSALFGDGRALDEIRAVILDERADIPQRRAALQVLIDTRAEGWRALCENLMRMRDLAAAAALGLAGSGDPAVGEAILAAWGSYYPADRPVVAGTLVSRPAWASKLLDAVAAGRVDRSDISAAHARQIRSFNDAALTRKLAETWGQLPGETGAEGASAIATWQRKLTPAVVARADVANGRTLFQRRCAACHKLNGEGAAVGPDLTGAARDNLAYLLENIITPSAVVPDEYRLTTLTMKDGRVLGGIVRERAANGLLLQSLTGATTVPVADISKQETSPVSLMPAGLLDDLSTSQARDLIGYLMARNGTSH